MDQLQALSPAECVALLEEAQCGDAAAASRALRTVAQRADSPHPSVTAVALQLLEIHPAATIAHLPDVISASSADVSAAVEAFGALLPTDRTLLVPMLGAMGDMPLSRAHEAAARCTLRYALQTVDGDDVPAVARALLRCARVPALARSAVATLRAALRRELSPHVGALLAMVIAEHARASSTVGRALRAPAAPHPAASGLDLVVWLVCLQRARAAFDALGDDVAEAIRISVRSGALLATTPVMCEAQVDMAGRIAAESPEGVVALMHHIVRAVPIDIHQSEVSLLVLFTRRLLKWCPVAANPVMADLARAVGERGLIAKVAETVLLGLVSSNVATPSSISAFISSNPVPSVAMALATRAEYAQMASRSIGGEFDNCPAWNEIFLKMRKGFVFGALSDKVSAFRFAHATSMCGIKSILKQLVALMDSVIPSSLVDPLATSFLFVISRSAMLGAVDKEQAAQLFEKRLSAQVPKGFFLTRNVNVKSESGKVGNKFSIQVDLAAIKDINPGAISAVVGAGLALICHQQHNLGEEKPVSSYVASTSVLVPVVCLPLYEAAQIVATGTGKESESSRKDVSRDQVPDDEYVPEEPEYIQKVERLSSFEFEEALEGCISSIAALIGVLNTANIYYPATWRILKIRHNLDLRYADGAYQDDMWALLERTSELLIMMEAISFGLAGYTSSADQGGDGSESEEASTTNQALQRNIRSDLKKRVEGIFIANKCLDGKSFRTSNLDELADYPVLSLSAAIALLIAIPDEKSLSDIEQGKSAIGNRDSELVKIEEFLFRRLVSIICKQWRGINSNETGGFRNQTAEKNPDGKSGVDEVAPELSQQELRKLLKRLEEIDEDTEDIFLVGISKSKSKSKGNNGARKRRKSSQVDDTISSFASPLCTPEDNACVNSMFAVSNKKDYSIFARNPDHPSEILYTPEFAALLLDRAATSITAASQKRLRLKNSGNLQELKALNSSGGFSLRLLGHVLQNMTVMSQLHGGSAVQQSNAVHPLKEFVATMGSRLVAKFPRSKGSKLLPNDVESKENEAHLRVIEVLEWISKTSIDVVSSLLALDCLALMAEYGIVSSGCYRELLLDSTKRLHEYGESALWTSSDMEILFSECIQDWITRRRRTGCVPVSSEDRDEAYLDGPWLTLTASSLHNAHFVVLHRLRQLFNGLFVEDAAREACAWAEEFATSTSKEDIVTDDAEAKAERWALKAPRVFGSEAVVELLVTATLGGLAQVRAERNDSLCSSAITQTYWWVRSLGALVRAVEKLAGAERHAGVMATLMTSARAASDLLLSTYTSMRTSVPDLDTRTLNEMCKLGRALTECAQHGGKLAAKLKKRTMAGAMNERGRAAVLRAKHSVPRLQSAAEAARRSAVAFSKTFGKHAQFENVITGDGVRMWRSRITGEDICEENEESDADVEEIDIARPQEGFHSTAGGELGRDTVVVSFRNAR